jgi:arabinose-5-phosphate isomerase
MDFGRGFAFESGFRASIVRMQPPTAPHADAKELLASARRTLQIEARAIEALQQRLDSGFAQACRLCLDCKGRVVVTGMGKSGHVARKVASTLASTGTPAFFLHPAEAGHGDLGMITQADLVIALTNSGETPEIVLLLPHLKRLGVPLIALTGNPRSTLGSIATVVLDVGVADEACPLNLAPTASTTAALAMGDALAVALLEARGFTREAYADAHPGGNLGRRVLKHVEQVMRTGDAVPRVSPAMTLGEGLLEMSKKGLGMTVVVDDQGKVMGVFTDGDLRRALDSHVDIHKTRMSAVMTQNPKSITAQSLATQAVHLMEQHRITALPVTDERGALIGALNVHDLLRAGVV